MEAFQRSVAFELLHREHEEAERVLGELMAREGDVDRARRVLAQTLRQHLSAEEKVFYAALEQLDMLRSFVGRMRQQHGLIRDALRTLCDLALDDPGFAAAVERLRDLVRDHVQEEETRAFAYAAEHLAGELEALAVELEHQRECERGAYGVG